QELKSGVRTDGTAYATYGLATKIGNAIGASIGIMLLHTFGYQANMEQSAATKDGINLVVNLLPAILFFLAALACLLWNLSDKDTDDIRDQLDKKREMAND
ncbi:MAG: MFS transporter, partial [Enterococcus hulanensis]